MVGREENTSGHLQKTMCQQPLDQNCGKKYVPQIEQQQLLTTLYIKEGSLTFRKGPLHQLPNLRQSLANAASSSIFYVWVFAAENWWQNKQTNKHPKKHPKKWRSKGRKRRELQRTPSKKNNTSTTLGSELWKDMRPAKKTVLITLYLERRRFEVRVPPTSCQDFRQWKIKIVVTPEQPLLVVPGHWIEVTAKNLGKSIFQIRKNTILQVFEIVLSYYVILYFFDFGRCFFSSILSLVFLQFRKMFLEAGTIDSIFYVFRHGYTYKHTCIHTYLHNIHTYIHTYTYT